MDVDTAGSGANGFANGGASRIGAAEGLATPVAGAMVIWAVRLGKDRGPETPRG